MQLPSYFVIYIPKACLATFITCVLVFIARFSFNKLKLKLLKVKWIYMIGANTLKIRLTLIFGPHQF